MLRPGCPAQIIFGGDELANGVLKVKRLSDHVEVSVRATALTPRP